MNFEKLSDKMYLLDLEPIPQWKDDTASYLLLGEKLALIESGPASAIPNLLSSLAELKIDLRQIAYLLVTHIHLDHAGGAGLLLQYLPEAKVVVHRRGAAHLVNPKKIWDTSLKALGEIAEKYGEPTPVPEERILVVSGGETIDLGDGVKLDVVETLGHASHHICFWKQNDRGIFTGDAAGIYYKRLNSITPMIPPPFDLSQAISSIDRLISLEPEVIYYTHFGPADEAVKRLKLFREQLLLWAKIVSEEREPKQIYQRLLREDASLKTIIESELPPDFRRYLEEIILKLSIAGLKEYLESSAKVT